MMHVRHQRGVACRRELVNGKVKGIFKALVGRLVVVVGVLGHDAHQQLVQRVLDAVTAECSHVSTRCACRRRVVDSPNAAGSAPVHLHLRHCACATAPAPHFRLPFRACLHWCCPHRCATHGLVTCSFATTISALRHPPHQILTTVALLAALCLFYLCPRIESVFRTPLVRGYSCRVLYGPKQSTTLEATSLMPCNHQPNLSTRCFPVHGLVQPLGTDPSYLVHL